MLKKSKQTTGVRELTLRGCIIASFITVLFTAANIYLGLKVGLTFASSIPAAVISMAVLKMFKDSSILENNMVQTFASSAGTLSAIIFVLPGLVIVGFWHNFPFWQTASLCAIGGILGVMYTIPLRRTLVVDTDLPYPEGVAAAEVLKVGEKKTASGGLKDIILGGLVAIVFSLCQEFKLLADAVVGYAKLGGSVFGMGSEYSFALIGAGYLIGMRVGIAILLGIVISWGFAVPIISAWHPVAYKSVADFAVTIWSTKVRFIGAGTIGVAAVWTLIILLKPIWLGIKASLESLTIGKSQGTSLIPATEQDIPIHYVFFTNMLLFFPMVALFGYFLGVQNLPISAGMLLSLVVICAFFAFVFGFIIAAVSGYMAGLVGSSNSPISGIGILGVILAALLLNFLMEHYLSMGFEEYQNLAIALALFMTSAVLAVACISNDNLQDLKTGHIVGATPWKQQVALILGVLVGSLVIPPILSLLYHAYGFAGALPRPNMDPHDVLNAPQAVLMASLAKGIISHQINWNMIIIGIVIGSGLIALDEIFLKPRGKHLSVLSMGLGIYLPVTVGMSIVIGSLVAYGHDLAIKRSKKITKQKAENLRKRGMLVGSGLIVGASVFGVIMAGLIVVTQNQSPLALVGEKFAGIANYLGFVVFFGLCYGYYKYILKSEQ